MKITTKQREEIEFLSKTAIVPFTPTDDEISDYINSTTLGKGNSGKYGNRLSEEKRNMDITVASWKEDMVGKLTGGSPICFGFEIIDDYKEYPYIYRLVKGVIKSLSEPYRSTQLMMLDKELTK